MFLAVFATLFGSEAKGDRPNFVLFLSDDHGQKDSTVYGAKDIQTPNMERIAKQGMVMTHAFVASPSCAPSRSAMLTGLMPARNGAEANHTFKRPEVRSMIEDLRELGYEVAAFGKVAHGKGADRYGFDKIEPKHDRATVENYLRTRTGDRPLCLFVGTHDPHVPWGENTSYDPSKIDLPAKSIDTPETRVQRTRYYTDVTQADRELGEIFDLTQKLLDPKRTLFLYTSDHGAQWPYAKWNLYDSGIRVPMIAVWPGVIEPQRSAAMVQWIDLLPTLVAAAGGEPRKEIDGLSFLPVLQGAKSEHREEIYSTHHNDGNKNIYPIRSVRTNRYKYIRNLQPEWAHTTHIDQGGGSGDGWRYFQEWNRAAQVDPGTATQLRTYYERPGEELYDLELDPDEQKNLAKDPESQSLLAGFRAKLEKWQASQNDVTPVQVEPRWLSKREQWEFKHP